MVCSDFDLRDYFFGEAPEAEEHVVACAHCAAGLEELRATRSVLLTLRDEEPPRRIGFVSDRIFEPSPWRRFLTGFWQSGARLGFASAAMLSIALLVSAARVQTAAVPADVDAIVAKAVKTAMVEQEKKTKTLLEASDRKHHMEEQEMAVQLAEYTQSLEKRMATEKLMTMSYAGGRQQ